MSLPEHCVQTEALPPLDTPSQHLCLLCLNCLAHLFSWIPLSSTITPSLLSTIFRFTGFGCDPGLTSHSFSGMDPHTSFSHSQYLATTQSLGVQAMCCVNELLAKNCVPQEFEDFLLQMFQHTFYLLQKITKENALNPTLNGLQALDDW